MQRHYACCGEATVLLYFKSLLHTELHEDASYKQTFRCPQQRSQWFSYLLQEFCLLNSTKQSTISLSVKQTKDRIKICHDGLLSEIPATRYSLPYCHKIQSRRRHYVNKTTMKSIFNTDLYGNEILILASRSR